MENNDTISVGDLRVLAEAFFDYLEKTMKIDEIKITQDFYWETLFPEKYNMDEKPEKLGVGQLSDDLIFLKKILEDEGLAVAANLTHFASILEYVCYTARFDGRNIL